MTDSGWHPVADPSVVELLVELTPTWLAHLLVFLTYLGSVFVVVPVVVAAYWWNPERFAAWIPAVVGYYSIMAGIKSLNSATRPDVAAPVGPEDAPVEVATWAYEHGAGIATTSFPSGNVIAATVLAGLFVIDARVFSFRRRLLAGSALVAITGYTRLGLGVHYPIDVVGGILIGLGYVGFVEAVRRHVRDEVTTLFAIAALLGLVAMSLRGGTTALPTVEALSGSNRPVAFGAGIGGLLAWLGIRTRPRPTGRRAAVIGVVAVSTTVAGGYLLWSVVSHPLWAVLAAAIAFGAAVVTPWTLSERHDVDWERDAVGG